MQVHLPGWYDDGRGSIRWWDGWEWTDQVVPSVPGQQPYVVHETPPEPALPPYAAPAPLAYAEPPAQGLFPPATSAPVAPDQRYGVAYPPAPGAVVAPLAPNGVGVAGFVVALISLFLPLFVGLVGGLVGLGLSIAGLAQTGRRKGLAIAGLIISIVAVILII